MYIPSSRLLTVFRFRLRRYIILNGYRLNELRHKLAVY